MILLAAYLARYAEIAYPVMGVKRNDSVPRVPARAREWRSRKNQATSRADAERISWGVGLGAPKKEPSCAAEVTRGARILLSITPVTSAACCARKDSNADDEKSLWLLTPMRSQRVAAFPRSIAISAAHFGIGHGFTAKRMRHPVCVHARKRARHVLPPRPWHRR
jgi:hypothetical protein